MVVRKVRNGSVNRGGGQINKVKRLMRKREIIPLIKCFECSNVVALWIWLKKQF